MSGLATSSRVSILARELVTDGFDVFFATSPITMGYLHGFAEGGGERFLLLAIRSDGSVRMICPALSANQATRAGIPDVRRWRDGEDPLGHFRQLASDWELRTARIAVDDEMSAAMLLAIQDQLPAAMFRPGQPIMGRIMRVKDARELNLMQQAADIADRAYEVVLPQIRAGQTELEVDAMLFGAMRDLGGKPTFCIAATGANGAEPHHLSDATVLREGDVVVLDFGCSVDGYQSDITRTIAVGRASDEAKNVYDIVYRAHMAGRAKVAPGVACQDVDRAAREVIVSAGYGEHFMHRTGHGIGMRGHEEPFIIEGNDLPLAPGHCFSVEPGIYLAGKFGVRLETIVTATEDGHRSFNVDPEPNLRIV